VRKFSQRTEKRSRSLLVRWLGRSTNKTHPYGHVAKSNVTEKILDERCLCGGLKE
jgi:hypothetical protein